MSKHEPEARNAPLPEKALKELFAQSHDRGRAGLPVMSLSMSRGLVPRDRDERRVETNLGDEEHRLVRAGELAYNMMRMWQGVCSLAEQDCLVSPAYVVIRPMDGMDPRFAEYLLTYEETVAHFKRLSFGVVDDRLRLYYKDFERVRVKVPSPAAQWKIAEILTTIDNLIEKTVTLIGKYQAIKQGMTHHLFTRGLDANGHLRPAFADSPDIYQNSDVGWIPKEWTLTPLRSCLVGNPTNGIYKPESMIGEGTLLVGQTAITAERSIDFSLARRAIISNQELGRYCLQKGDLLVARVFATSDGVGRPALVPALSEPAVFESNMMRLRLTRSFAPEFIFSWLQSDFVRRQIAIKANASNQNSINQKALDSLPVATPLPGEQDRILDVLSAMDARQERDKALLGKLRLEKAGLMHDLLTGKVRIKVDPAEEAAHA